MTTTMVVAVAALAVFIVISIIAIIILKKESRKRTASIKAIEKSITKMSNELAGSIKTSNDIAMDLNTDLRYMYDESVANVRKMSVGEVASAEMDDMTAVPEESTNTADIQEISFDFLDLEDLEIIEDMIFNEEITDPAGEYIVGRSGRKYTAKELEELIKE